MSDPIVAQRDSGAFLCLHGEERLELKAASLPEAVREIIRLGKPCPHLWWNKRGQEMEIPKAVLPR